VTWLALGGATLLQVLSGVVRVRGWFHVIRHCSPDAAPLRYRDVVVAHLGGCGWNSVLPARAGDAVKVGLVSRRLPDMPLATLASTLVAPALVEAAFTVLLLAAVLAAGTVSLGDLNPGLPADVSAPAIAVVACVLLVAVLLLRRRWRRLVTEARTGMAVVGRLRFLATRIVPWHVVARVMRLVALALALMAAGVEFGIGPALALMALQGATPSVTPAATAVRVALLAGVFAATGAGGVAPGEIVAVLVAFYALSSVANLAASAAVSGWVLRTVSPRSIVRYARSALGAVAQKAPEAAAQLARPARPAGAPPE